MKMNPVGGFCKKRYGIDAHRVSLLAWWLPAMALSSVALLWAGYEWGLQRAGAAGGDARAIVDQGRREVEKALAEQRVHLDALALRIARLQARMIRLDSLGERLVEIGKLDAGEFDFASEPGQGGLLREPGESSTALEVVGDLSRLERLLKDRESKLRMLEVQLANRELLQATRPSGRPVGKGWISSSYGKRVDPLNGRRRMHHGIDFAAAEGSPVEAVAGGVVIRSGRASGYGNLVEIRHPEGFTTLYAHNKENLVAAGDVIEKGEMIARLGSTGRSTGPHVHFEVRKDGRTVNPGRFIRDP